MSLYDKPPHMWNDQQNFRVSSAAMAIPFRDPLTALACIIRVIFQLSAANTAVP